MRRQIQSSQVDFIRLFQDVHEDFVYQVIKLILNMCKIVQKMQFKQKTSVCFTVFTWQKKGKRK